METNTDKVKVVLCFGLGSFSLTPKQIEVGRRLSGDMNWGSNPETLERWDKTLVSIYENRGILFSDEEQDEFEIVFIKEVERGKEFAIIHHYDEWHEQHAGERIFYKEDQKWQIL